MVHVDSTALLYIQLLYTMKRTLPSYQAPFRRIFNGGGSFLYDASAFLVLIAPDALGRLLPILMRT